MDSITYRYYLPGDEPGLVALWNRCLTFDPVTDLRFRKQVRQGRNVRFPLYRIL